MEVFLNSISGIPDAIEAMYFSKRTWNEELRNKIRTVCSNVLDYTGFLKDEANEDDSAEFIKWINTFTKFTVNHITLGKFVDFSFTVKGLHRGGQDDWDAHAERYNNRIIRSSTRLANFENEKSDFYEGKILTTDEALSILKINIPKTVSVGDKTYVKTVNGYILEEYKDDKDVKRGLYMLSIPSNFIFNVNLTQFAHVYKERNKQGSANPEVKECAEKCADLIEEKAPYFNRQLLIDIKN